MRQVPSSSRTQRIGQFPPTPSQMPGIRLAETPSRPRIAPLVAHGRSAAVEQSVKKANGLPGFYDAFAPTTGVRQPKAPKSDDSPSPRAMKVVVSPSRSKSRSPKKPKKGVGLVSAESSPTKQRFGNDNVFNVNGQDGDYVMDDGPAMDVQMDGGEEANAEVEVEDVDMGDDSSEYDEFEPFDRREDVRALLILCEKTQSDSDFYAASSSHPFPFAARARSLDHTRTPTSGSSRYNRPDNSQDIPFRMCSTAGGLIPVDSLCGIRRSYSSPRPIPLSTCQRFGYGPPRTFCQF